MWRRPAKGALSSRSFASKSAVRSLTTNVGEIYVVRFWLGGNSFGQESGALAIKSLVATVQ